MTNDAILIRIKKLLALATSDNENEAANAAAKAQDLLMEYNLTEADLDGVSLVKDEKVVRVYQPPKGHNAKNWYVSLSTVVARANLCKILTSGASLIWIGKPTNIEVSQFLTDSVAHDLERICDKNWTIYNWFQRENAAATDLNKSADGVWPSMPSIVHGKTWKNNFFYGAIDVIRERLNANLKQLEESSNMLALTVRNKQENDEFIDRTFGRLRAGSYNNSAYNHEARTAGRAAGQTIQFGHGLGSGGSNGTRLIGKG
jgi:hypothetical protein